MSALEPRELAPAATAEHGALSAHRLGLASALALGRALDAVPAELVILGISVRPSGPLAGIDPEGRAAIPVAVATIERLLEAACRTRAPS